MAMRIALVSWESMHSIAVGGLAAHVTELGAGLQRRGHDIHIFTRMGPGQSRYDCIEGVHYHRCPFEPHPDFVVNADQMCDSFIWHLQDVENYLERPFDIVHGHDWLSTRAVVRAKNELHHNTVFTMHSTEYGRCGNQLCNGQSERIRHYEWEGTFVADRVICVSKALRKEVSWLYQMPLDKAQVVYNGVNAKKFDADINIESVRRRHGIGVDDPCILFAGRLAWQKGPDLLVEAIPDVLDDHPETKFIFAGDGDMRMGLEARVSAIGAGRATRFLGHRNGLELISLFKSADAVCVPSRNEPFGIVILEAWSARKPVVTTRNGGPAEFVEHLDTGITVSDNTDSIGEGLGTVLAKTRQARRMGRNGRIEAETRFSWDTIAAKTEKIYKATTKRNSSAQHRSQEAGSMARRTVSATKKTTSKSTVKRAKTTTTARKTNGTRRKAVKTSASTNSRIAAKVRPTDADIRQRAHEIYLARNGAPGNPTDDWLRAERELMGL